MELILPLTLLEGTKEVPGKNLGNGGTTRSPWVNFKGKLIGRTLPSSL